jgi:magnesium transporter
MDQSFQLIYRNWKVDILYEFVKLYYLSMVNKFGRLINESASNMAMSKVKYTNFDWIDFDHPEQAELQEVTDGLKLDINVVGDTIQHGHLPKIEQFKGYTFIILRAYTAAPNANVRSVGGFSSKISFFLKEKQLITIHRSSFEFLSSLKDDYQDSEEMMLDIFKLMLASYEKPLEVQKAKMDDFERLIFLKHGRVISIEALYYQKAKARIAKKVLFLTQSVLNQITVKPELNSTLQDLKETVINYLLQYDEIIEDSHTILNSYLSVTSQKNNDVMKLLTIFSAFFLPLTFIVGIYGMNFDVMPELRWANGYFIIIGVMCVISLFIFIWFKWKKIL